MEELGAIKKQKKLETTKQIEELFKSLGLSVSNGTEYGKTDTTLIVHYEKCDIQIQVVAPNGRTGAFYGLSVSNGTEYGKTDTTLIVHYEKCDIQIQVVAPNGRTGAFYPKNEN